MGNQPKTTLPSFGILLNDSWKLYKERFILYLPFYFLLVLPNFVSEGLRRYADILALTPILTITVVLLLNFISLVGTISLILALKNKDLPIQTIYLQSFHRFLPFLGLSILYGLIILAGGLLLVIPAILFAIWFYFSIYIILLENTGIREALTRSKAYVQGYWWQVFWRLAPLFIFTIAATFFIIFLGTILTSNNAIPEIASSIIILSVALIIQLFLSGFTVIYDYQLYIALRTIHPLPEVKTPKKEQAIQNTPEV